MNTAPQEDRLHRLIAVGRALVSERDADAVLVELLNAARELTGARYAALGVLDEQRREIERFLTRGLDLATHTAIGDPPRGRGILGLLIEDPRPLRLHDLRTHPRSYGFPEGHPPMRSFLGVPILIDGVVWGNLYLTEKAAGDFDAEDDETATLLAAWAAIAIDRARLHERMQARIDALRRSVHGFEATTTITRAVGSDTDMRRVLELIVKRGRALVAARAGDRAERGRGAVARGGRRGDRSRRRRATHPHPGHDRRGDPARGPDRAQRRPRTPPARGV
jgi:GAF domain-containing protein